MSRTTDSAIGFINMAIAMVLIHKLSKAAAIIKPRILVLFEEPVIFSEYNAIHS